jgi:hypothetical protein
LTREDNPYIFGKKNKMAKDTTTIAKSIYEILDSYKLEIKERRNGVTVYVCKELKYNKSKYKQNQRKEENDLV